mgnify:CR=1 FL=1
MARNAEGIKRMSDEQLEWRKTVQVYETVTEESTAFDKILEYYSSWYALQKAVAWFLRYMSFLCCLKISSDEVKTDVIEEI